MSRSFVQLLLRENLALSSCVTPLEDLERRLQVNLNTENI